MNISLVCVDASFVVRLILGQGNPRIRTIWDEWQQSQRQVVAPELLFYEVTNALYQSGRRGVINWETADQAMKLYLALPIQLRSNRAIGLPVLGIARRFALPAAYDAQYLALAERLNIELWTVDQRLATRCQQAWIKLVE
jgi:predicted nucleic acid-binding protein